MLSITLFVPFAHTCNGMCGIRRMLGGLLGVFFPSQAWELLKRLTLEACADQVFAACPLP